MGDFRDIMVRGSDLTRGGFVGEALRQTGILGDPNVEAEDTEGGEVAPIIGAGEAPRQVQSGQATLEDAPVDPNAKKGPKSIYSVEGKVKPQLSVTDEQRKQEAMLGIAKQERGTRLAELQALGVADQELSDYANIDEMFAEEGARLHSEHFAVAKRRANELETMIDSARTMRVDPFNWGKSVGRGGRVAAAFSLLTGQMAAGAGNPNSSLKMMDAAIENDMAAQEQNLANEHKIIAMKKGLSADEAARFTREVSSLNTLRAMKYASVLSRIEAAKQHAITESSYLAYKHMGDHYTLKLLEAKAAAQAELLTVHVKGPIQASKAAVIQQNMKEIQSQITAQAEAQAGIEAEAAAAVPTVEPSAPAAPGRAGAVAARRGPRADTGGTPPSEARADTSAQAPTSEQATPQEATVPASSWVRQGWSLEQERAERGVAEETAAVSADEQAQAAGPAQSFRQLGHKAGVTGNVDPGEFEALLKGSGANDFTVKHGGFGRARAAAKNAYLPAYTRLDDALRAVATGQEIPNDGFQDPQDARIFSDMLPPPRRSEFASQAQYDEAMEYFNYASKKYEVFEAPGVQNTIDAGGRTYRVKATSTARNQDSNGQNRYNKIAEKLQESHTFIQHLRNTARNIRRVGLGTGGWFNEDEGAFAIPGLSSYDPGSKELVNTSLRLAMGFIKTEDPTARLSDKDVEIGEKAMSLLQGGKVKMLDLLQSFDGRFDDNTIRRSMDRYMQRLSVNAQKAITQQFQNDLVLDYNSQRMLQEESNETQTWLQTTPEWDSRAVFK